MTHSKLKCAISKSLNRDTLKTCIYVGSTLFVLDNLNKREHQYVALFGLVIGMEIALNYLDERSYEMVQKQQPNIWAPYQVEGNFDHFSADSFMY